ncbi:hypothetical protein [Candidatus Methylobacter oryzae]|uniref:Uncharacterized protein n=1 Tax=Candidatus Methylobacter oryzae TaxID=2497749 RepID=A0ABY3C536_9GAMM|nr:hypothetical protein [Candidatus Methylobacter oryzae]TRW89602.1 hypothetical protein EKO24_021315 [Candidatus Methylobacter oryzae]
MSLISCPECNKKISHKSNNCIRCDNLVKQEQTSAKNNGQKRKSANVQVHTALDSWDLFSYALFRK